MRICQDDAGGLLIQGEREWDDYVVRATIVPHLARSAGIAACVQGTRRFYALAVCDDGQARLIKELDGRQVLAQATFDWKLDEPIEFSLSTQGARLIGSLNGQPLFDVQDTTAPLLSGAIALFIEAGRLDCSAIRVTPS